jgi:hypothetical protein
MEKTPKPDLDEVFTLYGENPEDVAETLVNSEPIDLEEDEETTQP